MSSLNKNASNVSNNKSNVTTSTLNVPTSVSNVSTSVYNVSTSKPYVPSSLKIKIENLGKRVPLSILKEIIVDLCNIRPYSAAELAQILGRTEYHTIKRIIRPLMEEKQLFYTIPEMINHPHQKYTTITKPHRETK